MYFHSLNSNRYKITKVIFSTFLTISILNWTFMPNFMAYAEDEAVPAENVPAETVVETGAAVSQTEVQNDINTNATNTETPNTGTENGGQGLSDLNIQNQSEAEVENTAIGGANTGNNTASSTGGATINTGDAVASADVVNAANTNIVDSSGSIAAGGGSLGSSSLDLRDNFASTTASSTCSSCLGDISIENQNMATVTNNIIVSAETGNNSASSTATSTIITGNAYAGANVMNIVNTNIVKSNYMLLVFNNFGDWSGDLIFPNGNFFENFFSIFASGCAVCGGATQILNANSANVSNSAGTAADSGGNSASGDNPFIDSGNSLASSNVYNQINTNVYGSSSFYLLIKVFGDWNGNIFNLPAGIVWQQTPAGIILYNQADGNPFEGEGQSLGGGDLSVQNTNNADVLNNIEVSATTGNNNANGGSASIQTGNAYAGSNLVNIVNTNIISSNWVAALINIFGNWQGSVSFGQPDLWIGTVAESVGTLAPDSSIKFTTTIKNNGDATASSIRVLAEPQSRFLNINDGNEWFLSPLAAGESIEVSYYGTVAGNLPAGHTNITNQTSVSLYETDGNMGDNTDTITLLAYAEGSILLPYTSRSTTYPDLEVTKTHSIPNMVGVNGVEMIPFGGSADYKIVVKNNGGSAFEGVLFDQLKNEAGEIINEQSWDLGEILPNEEITVTYTTEFTASTTSGIYTNYAWVEALGGDYSYDPNLASRADSNVASDKVIVAEKQVIKIEEEQESIGEVLGIFTENVSTVNQEKQYLEFLGGFCSEEKEEDSQKLNLAQFILLGLSFILIMQKRKNIPHNLFLI